MSKRKKVAKEPTLFERIASDGKGGVSWQRLEELYRTTGDGGIVRTDDGHTYQLFRTRDELGRDTFILNDNIDFWRR
jgi:hypothetical protein